MAIDPVCKMDVDEDNPTGGQTDYQGQTYYFCAPGCLRVFEQEPEKYLEEADGSGGHAAMAGKWSISSSIAAEPARPSFFARLFGKKG